MFFRKQIAQIYQLEQNQFWFKYDLGQKYYTHPKLDLTGVRTHDLQIITVHFMSLRRLL